MHITSGETRTLAGSINENINMSPNSTLILRNVTLTGSISGDSTTNVKTEGDCILNGQINCGNLILGGNTTIGGSIGGPVSAPSKVMLGTTELQPGDWLMTDGQISSAYKHHFIYVGDGQFVSRQKSPKGVRLEQVSEYQGKRCWLVNRGGQETADRARARIGEGGFCLGSNNCEHFCSEVSNLGHHSEQVFVSAGKACVTLGSALANHLKLGGANARFTSGVSGGFTSMGGFSGGISFSL